MRLRATGWMSHCSCPDGFTTTGAGVSSSDEAPNELLRTVAKARCHG